MKKYLIRIITLLSGLALFAVGVVTAIKAHVGYAPWEVFHVGLSISTGLSVGAAVIIVGIVIVAIVTISGEKIGIGTVACVVVTGFFIDVILILDIIPQAPNMVVGIIMLLVGIYIISLGTYFYIKSAFGTGPRDSLMVVIKRKTKLPIGVCRSLLELTVTVAGWLLGGMIGVGTIISVFALGLFFQITFRMFKFNVAEVQHEMITETFGALKAKLKNPKNQS